MYGEDYLIRTIDVIFDLESSSFTPDYSFRYIEKPRDEKFGNRGGARFNFSLLADDSFSLEWDTYDTLKKLYNKIETFPSDKKMFIALLKNKISNCEDISIDHGSFSRSHNTASLAFYFLLNIGKYDEIIDSLSALQEKEDSLNGLFEDIFLFMYIEPGKFNEPLFDSLAELNAAYEGITEDQLYRNILMYINSWKYLKLKDDLNGVNEELNIDKEKVIEIINKYGFPQIMETYLLEIDKIPQFTDFQTFNSGAIGNLRNFFEELIKNIAEKIKDKTHEDYLYSDDPKMGEMGIKRKYIKIHLKLTDKDNRFINSFVDLLNKEGGHAFLSEKKIFFYD